jgi:hypothetical protein
LPISQLIKAIANKTAEIIMHDSADSGIRANSAASQIDRKSTSAGSRNALSVKRSFAVRFKAEEHFYCIVLLALMKWSDG